MPPLHGSSQMNWTEKREEILLHSVIVVGAHVCCGNTVTKCWNNVCKDVYLDELFVEWKPKVQVDFELKEWSNLVKTIRYKFKIMLKSANTFMEKGGNKSALPGGEMTKKWNCRGN